jgi:hypothetical protein
MLAGSCLRIAFTARRSLGFTVRGLRYFASFPKPPNFHANAGNTSKFKIVDDAKPPRMTLAIGPSISRPGWPLPSASGIRPSAVTSATASVTSGTSLAVSWAPPASSGGAPVSLYLVDWFSAGAGGGYVQEVQTVTVSALDGTPQVQTLTLQADGPVTGTFTLTAAGATTPELQFDASASDLAAALARLRELSPEARTQSDAELVDALVSAAETLLAAPGPRE